ncbi:hypothetical protein [Phytoactinopolyspora endophytica]|uniref:hypothetical protein n=1 Tax=Phytoactinopolyspora endophytica TaxID=1642495 RepID=UPI00101DC367|nr:hypothetical protein [Phytoactinopolyspora endophytica]
MPDPCRHAVPRRSHCHKPSHRGPDKTTHPPRTASRTRTGNTRRLSRATPLTVWRCGTIPISLPTHWPTRCTDVVEAIVASYSTPDDHIVLLDTGPATGGDDRVDSPSHDMASPQPTLARIAELGRHAHTLPHDPHRWPTTNPSTRPTLVIAALNPHQSIDTRAVDAWASLLRPNGVLAVLTHTGHRGAQLVDPAGAVVAVAQNADLFYLQHIVVLPRGQDHVAVVSDRHTIADSAMCAEQRRHRRVHADLLVWKKIAHPAPDTQTEAPR